MTYDRTNRGGPPTGARRDGCAGAGPPVQSQLPQDLEALPTPEAEDINGLWRTADQLATTTCHQIAVAYPAAWVCEGCATPENPLFIMPGDGQHRRQLVVTVVPTTACSGAQEYLLASLRQYVYEWGGLDRELPQTGMCALGYYATMIFRLPRSGRVLWFQRWHCSDGRLLVVASHASVGVPSKLAIAQMHRVVMGIRRTTNPMGAGLGRAGWPEQKATVAAGETAVSAHVPWWRRWRSEPGC